MVNVNEPAAVGIPLSTPDGARITPAGSDPPATENVNGPAAPDADNFWRNASPTCPWGCAVAMTTGRRVVRVRTVTGPVIAIAPAVSAVTSSSPPNDEAKVRSPPWLEVKVVLRLTCTGPKNV